jgi:hypothetical protein
MTPELRDALLDFLSVVMRFVMHRGSTAEQTEILERWQELYERLLGHS